MPQKGRPLKGASKKDRSLQLRLDSDTMNKLQECAEHKNVSRTEIVEQGIEHVYRTIKKKSN